MGARRAVRRIHCWRPGAGGALTPNRRLPRLRRMSVGAVLSADAVKAAARASRFTLVGLAPAAALDPGPLQAWLKAGYAADMDWMSRRLPERLDPRAVLAGAQTVIAMAIAYHRPPTEQAPIARYARGRDYHYAHRDGMKALRKRLLDLDPALETYAAVDTGVAMEKVWAERAGLGWIGKNGCLINPKLGSWLTLSVMFVDRAVDAYDQPHDRRCGDCTLCLGACPTAAFPEPGVVDAGRCIAYQSIENRGAVPEQLRPAFGGRLFGCDVCQEVCPWNHRPQSEGDPRFSPRPLSGLTPAEVAALSPQEFDRLAAGMALARAQYDGLRRNAVYAIGSARNGTARQVLDRLVHDASETVRDAARWALGRLDRA
jgi:epoxyqueuosine reductase